MNITLIMVEEPFITFYFYRRQDFAIYSKVLTSRRDCHNYLQGIYMGIYNTFMLERGFVIYALNHFSLTVGD